MAWESLRLVANRLRALGSRLEVVGSLRMGRGNKAWGSLWMGWENAVFRWAGQRPGRMASCRLAS